MSLSDRSSVRVVDEPANDLAMPDEGSISGADGSSPMHSATRTGSRAIERVAKQLSDRDVAIMASLQQLHYATTKQLERLHFAEHRSDLAGARASRRVLNRLVELQVIKRTERRIGGVRAGSASFVNALSPLGHRVMGTDTRRRWREPSLTHLDHVLAVTEVVVSLTEAVRRMAGTTLAYDGEPACWRPFQSAHGRSVLLKPDLYVRLSDDAIERHWFIELDRGSEHQPVLLRKSNVYVEAWRAGDEQTRLGTFPRVLWIVLAERRERVVEGVIRASAAPAGMFVVSTIASAIDVIAGASL